jgi:pantothenate kinase
MEAVYQSLAESAISQLAKLKSSKSQSSPRLVIAIAGPPGSGKTTSATHIAAIINKQLGSDNGTPAMVVSMDGFHYSRSTLDTFPNRTEAYVRRGAPWTFDSEKVLALVRQCHRTDGPILAPSFDHALKDPVEDSITILPNTQIVILEGNYLLVNEGDWAQIGPLVDERWFVSVDLEDARRRVAERHVRSGIEPDMASALRRVDANDLINGQYIVEHSVGIDVIIKSREEAFPVPVPVSVPAVSEAVHVR